MKEIVVQLPTGAKLHSCDCEVREEKDRVVINVGMLEFTEFLAEHYAKLAEVLASEQRK